MAKGEIHQWDVGTVFEATIKDENDQPVPIDNAILLLFIFGKPNNNPPMSGVGTFTTNGTDALTRYITKPGDLDKIGDWHVQAFVSLPGGAQFHSDQTRFHVYPNIG